MSLRVSIIISTRNRADSLRETLASLKTVMVPADTAVELIVVDNASTDRTPQVIGAFNPSHISLRYVRESRPGLSRSRNAGLAASAGDIVLFTDDDVRAPGNWIDGMCRKITTGDADAVAGGVLASLPICSDDGCLGMFAPFWLKRRVSILIAQLAIGRRQYGHFTEGLVARNRI